MNVPEWKSRIPIEVVLAECLQAVLPQVDAFYVYRFENVLPVPALRLEPARELDVMALRALSRETRRAVVSAFRDALVGEDFDEALNGYLSTLPDEEIEPVQDAVALRWKRVRTALHFVLGLNAADIV